MTSTIVSVGTDANTLFSELTADITLDLTLPPLALSTDFTMPPLPDLPTVAPLTLADWTSQVVDGTGVLDGLMKTITAHLETQFAKQRITGADYAKVYLGSVQTAMQFSLQFLLGRDRAALENAQLAEAVKLAQAQTVKAQAEIELVKAQIQQAQMATAELQLKAYTARNQYASSKMELVLGFKGILEQEAKAELVTEQIETQRAQTLNTRRDGAAVTGVLGAETQLKTAQLAVVHEEEDEKRAQTKNTLRDGGTVAGLLSVQKSLLTTQQLLVSEQVDTARASTKDTIQTGGAIAGILAKEKLLKDNQQKLVGEQYETQRAQTRGTHSDATVVGGLIGTQIALYNQQITSYQRDAEAKGLKMLLDTWTARKTIDEAVAVPAAIDGATLNTHISNFFTNLSI